ncbi:hypothetical protein ACHAXR_013325 [Thalassiosira sp. AJA248-18]
MSDNNLRQRRGKKSTAGTAAAASASPAETDPAGQSTPIEQLRSAHARLVVSRDRTADLHMAWKGQLFRLSLLVVFVTIHQLQSSISSCIREIKDSNDDKAGIEAIKLIFGDSFCELLGVVIASLLAYFLALGQITALELDHWPYMVSSAFVPMTLGFYFHAEQLGCLGGDDDISADDHSKDQRHQFPVVVIYHTIVTLAFWFMKNGMQQCEDHVRMVNESIEDFKRMDKKLALKKKLKGGAKKK